MRHDMLPSQGATPQAGHAATRSGKRRATSSGLSDFRMEGGAVRAKFCQIICVCVCVLDFKPRETMVSGAHCAHCADSARL